MDQDHARIGRNGHGSPRNIVLIGGLDVVTKDLFQNICRCCPGVNIRVASNGADAVALVEELSPDLVFIHTDLVFKSGPCIGEHGKHGWCDG